MALVVVSLAVAYPRGMAYWHGRRADDAVRAEDFEVARAHLALVLRIRPDHRPSLLKLASIARRDNDLIAAHKYLAKARAAGGTDDEVRLEELLVAVQEYGWRGNDGPLLDRLQRAPTEAARIHEVLANAYYRDYLFGPALLQAESWCADEPWSGRGWQLTGVLRSRMGNRNGAIEAYVKAVECNPDLPGVQTGYATTLFRTGRPAEALHHFDKALELNPWDREARIGRVRSLLQLDRVAEARDGARRLAIDFPNDTEVAGLAGRAELLAGDAGAAEPLLRLATSQTADWVMLHDLQQCLVRLGKRDEARALEPRVAQLRADLDRMDKLTGLIQESADPAPRLEAGRIMIRNGRKREGLAWLYEALRCAADYKPAHAALADYFEESGHPEAAAYHRRQAVGP
ncbi:MAG TPA: tetratricopeptide repeat protein [Gemmataceae bacterium]|nr:tetratricopeptide repeat protein [Gemmataceae bacterium]